MDSVYIDTETFDFIPHEIHLSLGDYDGTRVYEDSYTIECNDPRYELVEMNTDKEHNFPRTMAIICGEQPELVEKGLSDQKIGGYGWVLHDLSPTVRVYERKTRVIYQGEDAELYSYVKVDIDNRLNRLFFLTGSAAIVVLMVFAAMLLSWRRYTIDKADCAMEDYQRSITNNLAHDIKTPLAAIGGYAENLGEMLKDGGDEKQQRYAQSIIDNVTRIDEVINRALKLNKIDQADKLSVCSMSLRSITEECIKRYADQLESRGITYKTEGDAEVKADKEMMQTAIDNLISNAAKYTRTDGEIKVTIDKRRMKVVNTVSGRIETAELKKPFVRGDKARTDRSGSGLGLSIAESALARNGFGLKISSTETEFTAEIRL
jgi:signal transduction histidine kinase